MILTIVIGIGCCLAIAWLGLVYLFLGYLIPRRLRHGIQKLPRSQRKTFPLRSSKGQVNLSSPLYGRLPMRLVQPVDAAVRRELLALVYGDEALALRLLEQAAQRFPRQTDQWLYEKVIYDLKRDRH